MQPEPNKDDYVPFIDEDGDPLYFRVASSVGLIPVRIDGMRVLNRSTDRSQISIDYQIDADHPDCPDLNSIDEHETVTIMTTLKEQVPKLVTEMLEDASKQESTEDERNL